jgi:hypothetical protein
MRFAFRTLCVVALVACADSRNIASPTFGGHPLTGPSRPDSALTARLGPQSIPELIEELVAKHLVKVDIPADNFSRSPDAVHPDMVCPPESWSASAGLPTRCWLLYTPYKNSDPSYENPAMLAANTDTAWVTPPQVSNPIIPYPGTGKYNSDPDQAYDPTTNRIVQVYRVVDSLFNNIMIMSTGDAKQWTVPVVAFQEPNHNAVSPTLIIEPDRTAKMWYVSSGPAGCSSTASTVQLRVATPGAATPFEQAQWSRPTATDLGIPNAVAWHIDVDKIGGFGYVALVVAFPKGLTCSNSDLWLATSPDGLHWRTYPLPVLWRTMAVARRLNLNTWYRGTIRYDSETDSLHLWPSALVGSNWTVYHAAAKLHDLLGLLGVARPAASRSLRLNRATSRSTIPMP